MIVRATHIHARYQDRAGEPAHLEATGWPARILQHAIDHLDGCLRACHGLPGTAMSAQAYVARWRQASLKDALSAFCESPT